MMILKIWQNDLRTNLPASNKIFKKIEKQYVLYGINKVELNFPEEKTGWKLLNRACKELGEIIARGFEADIIIKTDRVLYFIAAKVKKLFEFDYPPLKEVALSRIHGFATIISFRVQAKPKLHYHPQRR